MSQRCRRRSLRHGSGAGTRRPTRATRRLESQLRAMLFFRSRLRKMRRGSMLLKMRHYSKEYELFISARCQSEMPQRVFCDPK